MAVEPGGCSLRGPTFVRVAVRAGRPQGAPGLPLDQVLDRLVCWRVEHGYRLGRACVCGYLAHGSIVRAVRGSDEQRVRDALMDGVRALIAASGGVRIEDEYRYFIATA
jgi:hypothetical protein